MAIGDEVAVVGHLHHLLAHGSRIGSEIEDVELLRDPIESCRLVVLRARAKRLTLDPIQLADRYGCFLARVERLGVEVPVTPDLRFEAGDVLHATGHRAALDRLGADFGHIEGAVDETDLVTFGLGIGVGTFIGGVSIVVTGISVGFGSGGGVLAAGLTIGYLSAIRPTFGRVPGAARWVFMGLGLLIFMAGVGLRAGS